MKRNTINIFIAMATLPLMLVSCSKFLDVKPEDKFLEDQVFSSEANVNAALNGVYMNMTDNNLYGANLTMTIPEILAQSFNVPATHNYYQYAQYNYDDKDVKVAFDKIWTNAYMNILNVNHFIGRLEKSQGVVSPAKMKILLGEAYGLRAFFHFDMLRMFGPVCNNLDSVKISIPYYRTAAAKMAPLLPGYQAADSVLADLKAAEQFLANDPVIKNGLGTTFTEELDDFTHVYRNRHMNYYAVKALQARVYLYKGNTDAAYSIAKAVLDEGEKWFPWTSSAEISNSNAPDRVFSSEVLFGMQNSKLYDNHKNYFDIGLADKDLLVPLANRLKVDYGAADFRYISFWKDADVRTFQRYADIQSSTVMFRGFQPLLRKTELYYIIAECTKAPAEAVTYLNLVRAKRGLGAMSTTVNDEIKAEYIREFYGEGQLFFYYKRKNIAQLPIGTSSAGTLTPEKGKQGAVNYVVPLPLSETQSR